MAKLNLRQQKHAFTNQKKSTTTQINKKTKARFSHLLWHPAWKWRGPILVLALQKFVTYFDTYQSVTAPDPHRAEDGWQSAPKVNFQPIKWRQRWRDQMARHFKIMKPQQETWSPCVNRHVTGTSALGAEAKCSICPNALHDTTSDSHK